MDLKEVWNLKEEGKLFTIDHSSSSDWGERNIALAFEKMKKKKEETK